MVLKLGHDPRVHKAAQKIAVRRMRIEILPLLSRPHPRPNNWNPLRADVSGPSAYGMKLWKPETDAHILEIMRTPALMERVEAIVVEATAVAAVEEPKAFVTNIIASLIDTDG